MRLGKENNDHSSAGNLDRWWRIQSINKHRSGASAMSARGPANCGYVRRIAEITKEETMLIRSVSYARSYGLAERT